MHIYIYSDRPFSISFCAFLCFFLPISMLICLKIVKYISFKVHNSQQHILVQTVLAVFSGVDRSATATFSLKPARAAMILKLNFFP